jgi:hypothetical protein
MDDFDYSWQQHRDELYSRVVKRGRSIKTQRRAIMSAIVAIVVALPIAAYAASTTPSDQAQVYSSTVPGQGIGSSSTTTPSPTTTQPPAVGGQATTTTTLPACHDSFDTACGPFHWTSPPPTTPLVELRSPAVVHTTVGTPTSITIATNALGFTIDWGDSQTTDFGVPDSPECQHLDTPSGPWTPYDWTNTVLDPIEHTYDAPGTYLVHVALQGLCEPDPRLPGAKSVDVAITVDPAADTSTSSSTSTSTTPPSTTAPPQGP